MLHKTGEKSWRNVLENAKSPTHALDPNPSYLF